MRNLKTSDIFEAIRLTSAIGIREEIKEVARYAEENKGKKIRADFGVDFLLGILEKAAQENAEKEIYKFFANILECEWEAVRDMDPIDFMDELEKVADWKRWINFFKRVAKAIGKK